MPIIRINARGEQAHLHRGKRSVAEAIARHEDQGPVIVMIHGYKYRPGVLQHCPHLHIMALHPQDIPWRAPSWPRQLGFGTGHAGEGLAIAFGWDARGLPWAAQQRAVQAGRALAWVVAEVHRHTPGRPVHILAHSMGIELALEALHHLPAGSVDRIVSMAGAGFLSRTRAALQTPAGRTCEFFNVTSRENDMFDFLFERLVAPGERGDRALGSGLDLPNVLNLQIDCDTTRTHLARLGTPIGEPDRRICHWSVYTRPGTLRFYNELMRQPDRLTLAALRRGLPETPARRWSRLVALPNVTLPLPAAQKAS